MTTKPKTRKAPVAKPATLSNEATVSSEPKRKARSEIEVLVSRHKFLEADQDYRAATAPTDEEEDRLLELHHDELRKIEGKLATLVPDTVQDISSLLEFVTDWAGDGYSIEGVNMLKNIRLALLPVWSDEVSAEVEKARKKGVADAHNFFRIALDVDDRHERERTGEAA